MPTNLGFSAVDLFSGCGGLTLGLKLAGFRVLGAIDNDDLAISTYQQNHPEVKAWKSDIRKVPASSLGRAFELSAGELDLLAGCPPCQGFSSIRTLNGNRVIADARNELIWDFLRFVRVLKPRTVMMENVPGITQELPFSQFVSDLIRLKYSVQYQIVDAADYGVPQRRKRLILLASTLGQIDLPDKCSQRQTVRGTISALQVPGSSGDPVHDIQEHRSDRIRRLIQAIPKDGGSRHMLPGRRQLTCHKSFDGFNDVYGRMRWDSVSPTITGGCINPSKGRFLHPEQDRAITLREAALLQTFPPDYKFSLKKGKYAAATLIGNALPPMLIDVFARSIHNHLQQRSKP